MNIDTFFQSIFLRVNRVFILIYSKRDNDAEQFKAHKILFSKMHNQKL